MKNGINSGRIIRILIILTLCIALLPAGVIADELKDGAIQRLIRTADNGTQDDPYADQNISAEDTGGTETGTEDNGKQNGSAPGSVSPADVTSDSGTDADMPADVQPFDEEDADAEEGQSSFGSDADEQSDEQSVSEPAAAAETEDAYVLETSRKVVRGKSELVFESDVLVNLPLEKNSAPAVTRITGKKKCMYVEWTPAADPKSIDGYIVLRRTGKGNTYTEIKRTRATKTAYTDKDANEKNITYTYTVVGFKKDGKCIHISSCASWAAGKTSSSRYANGYEAAISKSDANLQIGDNIKLTLKYSEPEKIFMSSSVRWYSDNSAVASVSSKGKVTAKSKGKTVIRGRLASGRDMLCKVNVVEVFTPVAPVLAVECSTTRSIELSWNKVRYATSYLLYRLSEGGSKYEMVAEIPAESFTGTYTDRLLLQKQYYKYYVKARNVNGEYTAESKASNKIGKKTVNTPYTTVVEGFPAKAKKKAGSSYAVKIKVKAPYRRKARLQLKEGKTWTDAAVVRLPSGNETAQVKIVFPDTWWKHNKTSWRLVIPKHSKATAYKSKAMTLTTLRRYQNPSKYIQIRNTISKHGHLYYTSPVLVNNMSTRSDHVEAMINTAYKYLGDPYVVCRSGAPGEGLDCSGLVMQACYGAGVDLWPVSPYRHRDPAYEYESRNIANMKTLKTVKYSNRKRGDLIFFCNSSGVVIHVAIYLGNNRIIHSTSVGMKVVVTGMGGGSYGRVCKVKRVFVSSS